jgi:hypothetical protein
LIVRPINVVTIPAGKIAIRKIADWRVAAW